MAVAVTNNACSKIVGGIDNAVTAIKIGPEGALFPQLQPGDWFYGTLSNDPNDTAQLPEIVKVTVITIDGSTGYDLTVERGAGIDGAAAKSWSDQSDFQLLVTSELLYDLVTGGIAVNQATSFILNSKTIVGDYQILVEDNGLFLNASPSANDQQLLMPEIPNSANEDIRIVINKRSNTADGGVIINAFTGQTINGVSTLELKQQYASVILHGKPGDTNWDAIEAPNFAVIPEDGKVYGISYGPTFVIVTEEAPEDGKHYVRRDGTWVVGVPEAPVDGNSYARKDENWEVLPDFSGPDLSGLGTPSGAVIAFGGSEAPEGWLLCDGATYERAGFSALFAAIGTTFGNDTSVDFRVPDMRGRTARGVDNMGGNAANVYPGRNTIGSTAGMYQWTMSSGQMPSHKHTVGSVSGGKHKHNVYPNPHNHSGTTNRTGSTVKLTPGSNQYYLSGGATSSNSTSLNTSDTATDHSHSISINNTGSGNAIQSASPFMDLNYIIKS